MADTHFVFNKQQVDRLREMITWFETSDHVNGTFNRPRQLGSVSDIRATGNLAESLSSTDASIDVHDIATIYGPIVGASSSDTQEVFNPDSWEGSSGDGCRFEFNRSSSQFELYAIHNTDLDKRYTGFLTGVMSTGTSFISVDNISRITGPELFSSSSDTQTVFNTHGWEGDNNGFARFEWNQATDQYEFYAIDCPST